MHGLSLPLFLKLFLYCMSSFLESFPLEFSGYPSSLSPGTFVWLLWPDWEEVGSLVMETGGNGIHVGVWDALIPRVRGWDAAWPVAMPSAASQHVPSQISNWKRCLFSRFNARVPQNKQIARARVQTCEHLGVCTCVSLVFPSNTNLFFYIIII